MATTRESPAVNLQLAAVASARCLLRLLRSGAQCEADGSCIGATRALESALEAWLHAHAPAHEDIL